MRSPTRRGTTYAVALLVIVVAVLAYAHDRNGDSLDFSDTQVRIVISGSMDGEPREQYDIETIPIESMVFIREVPTDVREADDFYSSLRVGDVLTFNYTHPFSKEFMVVTHRIIEIRSDGDGLTYILKGDSLADDPTNGSVQEVTSQSGDVIGKVVGVAPWLGSLVVFLSTWTGKMCLIVIPCIILIVSEVRNIVRVLRDGDIEGTGPCDVPPGPVQSDQSHTQRSLEDLIASGPRNRVLYDPNGRSDE